MPDTHTDTTRLEVSLWYQVVHQSRHEPPSTALQVAALLRLSTARACEQMMATLQRDNHEVVSSARLVPPAGGSLCPSC